MTFDPFGDFETHGYLRNVEKEKNPAIVRRLEHTSFLTGIDEALALLADKRVITYDDILEAHRILFEAIYPWAGEDRLTTAPQIAVRKGPVLFAHPNDIARAANEALKLGQDEKIMRVQPGLVMGYLAYAHPFLDGNGRTIMLVHCAMGQRAWLSIDWAATSKTDYLTALTAEIDEPHQGHLDAYLKPFHRRAFSIDELKQAIIDTPGLDGHSEQNEVLGENDDENVKAQYEQQKLKRHDNSNT